jgi:hypothetical protein
MRVSMVVSERIIPDRHEMSFKDNRTNICTPVEDAGKNRLRTSSTMLEGYPNAGCKPSPEQAPIPQNISDTLGVQFSKKKMARSD